MQVIQKTRRRDINYSVKGFHADKLFGVFNGISIIATCYASGIIPEIQVSGTKHTYPKSIFFGA
jgi:hypothetical protein